MTTNQPNRTALLAAKTDRHVTAANELLAAGFQSEARRKEALGHVSSAYQSIRYALHDRVLADFPADQDADGRWFRAEPFRAISDALVFDLHQFRPKHAEALVGYPVEVAQIGELVELRAAIKAAPVEPKPVRQDHPLLVFAKTSGVDFAALRDRRVKQYSDALDLGRKLGGLPVHVQRVFCGNWGGTTWIRLDWYLRGRRTPFNTIAAAYDQLVREGTIVEETR